MKTDSLWQSRAVNFFGGLGYISCLAQWSWFGILVLYPIIQHGDWVSPLPSAAGSAHAYEIEFGAFAPLVTWIVVIVSILIIGLSIIMMIRMPIQLARQASRKTITIANKLTPQISHHKKITKQERRHLNYQIILFIKIIVTVLPLALLIFSVPPAELPAAAVWAVGWFLAACSIVVFTMQYMLGYFLSVSKENIW